MQKDYFLIGKDFLYRLSNKWCWFFGQVFCNFIYENDIINFFFFITLSSAIDKQILLLCVSQEQN